MAITCAVCHDPHSDNSNPAQVRNPPLLDELFFPQSTSAVFTNVYAANTNINLCGQCHNGRAGPRGRTLPARRMNSPQYNLLLGSIGQLWNGVTDSPATFDPGTHAGLPNTYRHFIFCWVHKTNFCVSCHMQSDAPPAHHPEPYVRGGVPTTSA